MDWNRGTREGDAQVDTMRFTTRTALQEYENKDPFHSSHAEKAEIAKLNENTTDLRLQQKALENNSFTNEYYQMCHVGKNSKLVPKTGHWCKFKAPGQEHGIFFKLHTVETMSRCRSATPDEVATLLPMFESESGLPLDDIWSLPWKVTYDGNACVPHDTKKNERAYERRHKVRQHYCLRGFKVSPNGEVLIPVCVHYEIDSPHGARTRVERYPDSQLATTFLFLFPLIDEQFRTEKLERASELQMVSTLQHLTDEEKIKHDLKKEQSGKDNARWANM
jgi:hypothetical protein